MVEYQWKLQQIPRHLLRPCKSVSGKIEVRRLWFLISTQRARSAEPELQHGSIRSRIRRGADLHGAHREHADHISVRQAFPAAASRTIRQLAAPSADRLSRNV